MGKSGTNCLLIMYVLFFIIANMKLCSCCRNCNSSNLLKSGCKPSEQKALSNFKSSVVTFDDHDDVWSSWEGEDCCRWRRVMCNPTTGHVVQLHLQGKNVDNHLFKARETESSLQHLLELTHLEYLDVSLNNFINSKIPKFMGSMKQLRYLNLSHSSFSGVIPHELGNLTNLKVLDLSDQYKAWLLIVDSLSWVSNLRELQHLDLSGTNLSQSHDWIDSLTSGPFHSLRELHLSGCNLMNTTFQTHLSLKNSSLLDLPIRYLDLGHNNLMGDFPKFIQNLTSLEFLDLSYNNFGPLIPLWLGKLKSLTHLHLRGSVFTGIEGGYLWGVVRSLCRLKTLDLSYNKLQGNLLEPCVNASSVNCTHFALEFLDLSSNHLISGHIPAWLGEKFQSLETLSLGDNNMSGEIPTSLGMLSAIETLNISYNPLIAAVLSETYFVNLSSLTTLDMRQTFLTLKLPFDWVPPFQLQELHADSCNIKGPFPQWIKTQKNLRNLYLSNASIHGVLPKWFHKLESLSNVDLSSNQITGCAIFPIHFYSFSLSHNSISCLYLTNDIHENSIYNYAKYIYLSNNNISGELPEHISHNMPNLTYLVLSNNQINGSIPKSICHFTSLTFLELQKNRLSGTIPDCLGNSSTLEYISLSSNKLSGNIPCFKPESVNNTILSCLHLNDNLLGGETPSCLANLSSLAVLDVGENELSGKIPTWITGENFPFLQILRFRNNKLKGHITKQLCSVTQLQLLDLGYNYLAGRIPHCFSNLTGMMMPSHYPRHYHIYMDGVLEVVQGTQRQYTTTLGFLMSIDLSCNKLVGSIPHGITKLQGLVSLNLSCNQLTGLIPRNVGQLKSMVSLDFSRNKLHGIIPTSMADLYALEHLNLSYNNLSGQIPTGRQLQTLNDPSMYAGNPYLCGEPLPEKCKSKKETPKGSSDKPDEGDKDNHEHMWFCLVVMSGFATGFWVVVGTIVLKRSWRRALFRRVEYAQNWLYVAIDKLKKKGDASFDGSNISG